MPEPPDALTSLAQRAIAQLAEEGVNVAALTEQLSASFHQPDVTRRPALRSLLASMEPLVVPSTPNEPLEYEAIRAQAPRAHSVLPTADPARLQDQILGGWLGRCAGCLLGKPLEGAITHWEKIEAFLREADAYPLRDYVPLTPELETRYRMHRSYRASTRGNIHGMPRDDDIDYVLLNLLILERHGDGFTPEDAASEWLEHLSYHTIYAAGRAAYRNLVNGLVPPHTAWSENAYRQSLGAQIRADTWGWVRPANPQAAAELAYRDAVISQTRNGVYSGMFFAATISAAFVAPDVRTAVEAGLEQIPSRSTLSSAVRALLGWVEADADWRKTIGRIYADYGHQATNYSIVNALISLLGPLYAPNRYTDAIGITVMGGFDTDCTGATAGSIMGVLSGADALPRSWVDPLEDRYHSFIVGIGQIPISELARRTAALARP